MVCCKTESAGKHDLGRGSIPLQDFLGLLEFTVQESPVHRFLVCLKESLYVALTGGFLQYLRH